MATKKQLEAAKIKIKKAQAKWRAMSPTEHARAQPEGRARAKPGTKGEGKYYRIVVRPKERKNLLPLGTTMLDDQDMYKDLQAKDQVSHGMIKHGSLAKKIPILRLET